MTPETAVYDRIKTVTSPPDTDDDFSYVGTEHDDVERTAFLPKDLLISKWDEVTVTGTLKVITHPATFCNGQKVPECVEIRIVRAKLLKSSRQNQDD